MRHDDFHDYLYDFRLSPEIDMLVYNGLAQVQLQQYVCTPICLVECTQVRHEDFSDLLI